MKFEDEFMRVVSKTASSVAFKFPLYVTEEDLSQEMYLYALSTPSAVALMKSDQDWPVKLAPILKKVGYEYAQREEAHANGYEPEDVYHYSEPVLRTLLEDAFVYEDWQSFQAFGDGQPRAKGQVNETGDRMAMLSDVKAAWSRLPKEKQEIVFVYYAHFKNYGKLGEWLGISYDAARQRLNRAVGALQRELGRKTSSDMRKGFTGRTEPSTNAAARYAVERDYCG